MSATEVDNGGIIYADTLKPGDRFSMRDIECTVLREAEPWKDPFGRTEGFIKIWCSSAEGREGYVKFGPGGWVETP